MITKLDFGTTKNGLPAEKYIIENKNGAKVVLTDYGACVISIIVPDKDGKMRDVTLGYDTLEEYENNAGCFGATCGRYGGRLRNGEFVINGEEFNTPLNNGKNTLHGGREGFNKKVWASVCEENAVTFSYVSKDGEEGFPGNLAVTAKYELTDDNELLLTYAAKTDKDTVINIINHTYFNMAGHDGEDAMKQKLILNSEFYLPYNSDMQSTGEILRCERTPFDFTEPHAIGERIDEDNIYLNYASGYDVTVLFKKEERDKLEIAAQLYSEESGIRMTVYTTQPGAQIYSGNFIQDRAGKGGAKYGKRSAICIESHHFPDSMYNTHFPNPVLRVGQMYVQRTAYKFDVI